LFDDEHETRERPRLLSYGKEVGERAPHKPLLALCAIGHVLRGEPRTVPYAQVDRDLGKLLMSLVPARGSAGGLRVPVTQHMIATVEDNGYIHA
jgi:hypothetical protein